MRASRLLVLLLCVISVCLVGFALPEQPRYHVNDYAHALDAGSFSTLESRFSDFERRTGHQAAVAIFPTIDDEDIDDLASKLFEKWRLGTKKENDGVLLVLAMQEHKARIEVGYGLEGQLPDALAGRIIHDDMFPLMRQGQVAQAVAVYERRLEQIIIEGKKPYHQQQDNVSPFKVILFVLFFFVWLFSAWLSYQRRRTLGGRGVYGNSGWWWWGGGGGFGGGGGWGGGGFGGGGWGGGGGGLSGGGGASGQW